MVVEVKFCEIAGSQSLAADDITRENCQKRCRSSEEMPKKDVKINDYLGAFYLVDAY